MGNKAPAISTPVAYSVFRVLSSDNVDCPTSLDFDPKESYVVAFGVDKFTVPGGPVPDLGETVKTDAQDLCLAFFDAGVAPEDNIRCYVSSNDSERPKCTSVGIAETIRDRGSKVGPNGLLVIYYAGCGLRHSLEWRNTLTPCDFDKRKPETYLTGQGLYTWLAEVKCRAKAVLLILDTSYASAFADDFVPHDSPDSDSSVSLPASIYVLASSGHTQHSLVIHTLSHSVFTYFLLYALKVKATKQAKGKFPIQEVYEECKVCCEALTSLVFRFDKKFMSVVSQKMKPQLKSHIVDDGEYPPFVVQYFSRGREPNIELSPNFLAWLTTLANPEITPLKPLIEREMLNSHNDMLRTVIAATMSTAAAFQLQDDKDTAYNPDVFLLAFCKATESILLIIERLTRNRLEVTHEDLQGGLKYYLAMIGQSVESGLLPSSLSMMELERLEVALDANAVD